VVTLQTGETVEAAMVGVDGVVGASAALDGRMSLSRGIVQLAGDMVVCSIDGLKSAALQSPQLLSLLIRHEQTCPGAAVRGLLCHPPCPRTALSLAAAGAGSVRIGHVKLHPRISCANAWGSANQYDGRRPHLADCRSHQTPPRKNRNSGSRSPA
jgi:hypothetical protein